MTHAVELTRDQLLQRREHILERFDTTLSEFTERAHAFCLVGEEWDAWDELQNISFLLGDD
ncbi:hypothetical protein [Saccharomonospora piscinae]|uniref:hypothetical protein n=1 Tax=Saccharomonospora piscinae TaxID=687388 RepID=UPI00056C7444|nr:hypothetical protein [Saccharomonospora piscinae]TLW93529.1 hypothetical protein FFT09_09075 [Saccharomonospora piscinae]